MAKNIKKVKKELQEKPAVRIALEELGLLDEVNNNGWLGLTSSQCGRVGAVVSAISKRSKLL